MIITMKRQLFDSLSNEMIGHTCFEPMVPIYQNKMQQQNSKDSSDSKAEFYKTLTKGQQALFMFFVYYDHAINSKFEFHRISNLYLSSSTFSAVKKGVEYFGDDRMSELLLELEDILKTGNSEILEPVFRLYATFQEIAPETIKLIGACIKENPFEFIQFEE